MFLILILIGISLIALGMFAEKKYGLDTKENKFIDEIVDENKNKDHLTKTDNVEKLEDRIEVLEKMLFSKVLEEEKVKKTVELETEEVVEEDSYEKYKLIKKYERQKKSLDEIAKLLDTNKGEVILLKNIYKNS